MKLHLLAAALAAGAAPKHHVAQVAIPTQVELRRDGEQVAYRFDPTSYTQVRLEVSDGLLLGTETTTRLKQGGAWVEAGLGLQSGPPSSDGASYYPAGAPLAGPGDTLEVEIHFLIFETDKPPQHHWLPRSETFRVLGEWTVRGAMKLPPSLRQAAKAP